MHKKINTHTAITVLLFILIPLSFGLFALFKCQDATWDLRNYHLYNGFAFINDRLTQDLAPAGMQTYFNPFLDVVYYLLMTHAGAQFANFVLGLVQGISFIILYLISLELFNAKHNYLIALSILGVLSIWFISEVGTTAYDSLLTLPILYSLFLILKAIKIPAQINVFKIALSAFILGLVCGLKLVMAPYAVAISLAIITLPVTHLKRVNLFISFGIFTILGLMVSGGFWFYKVYLLTGNPLFPQFNHFFESDWVASNEPPIRDTRFYPRNFLELIAYPVFFTAGPWRIDSTYQQISWVLIYLGYLTLAVKILYQYASSKTTLKPNHLEIFFLTFCLLAYLCWQFVFSIYRYLIPIEVLSPFIFLILIKNIYPHRKNIAACFLVFLIAFLYNTSQLNIIITQWRHPVFSLNMPELKSTDTDIVILGHQPLAWLIPFLNKEASYIQLEANFLPSDAYWQHAQKIIDLSNGFKYIIFDKNDSNISLLNIRLQKINMSIIEETCQLSDNFISTQKFSYFYCKLDKHTS